MKKIVPIIFSLCCMILFCGCSLNANTYTKISDQALYQKIENKDDFILTIGSANCNHCANFQPKMESMIEKYKIKVYYIDASKLSKDEYKQLEKTLSFTGTPTTIFFENGKETSVMNRINGDTSIEVIEEKLKKAGYIKG